MAYFSVNKVINRVITTLNAYDAGGGSYPFLNKCHNHFGDETGNFDEILRQNGHIYIFYGNEEYENPLTNYQNRAKLYIEFWIIDLVKGVSSTKEDFQADNLKAYLLSSSTGWRDLGIPTDYATMQPSPYFVESVRPVLLLDEKGEPTGYLLTVFNGYIRFQSSMR